MLTRLQEIALIARCVAGDDRNAFGSLVEAYVDDIRRMLDRLTGGDVALVDDLTQETFVKAYLSLRSFKGVARFRTWLFRIAYNEFITHVRKNTHFVAFDDTIHDTAYDDSEPDGPSVDAVTVEEAIGRLSPALKAIVQLYYYENFSVSHISEIMQMPSGTVKSNLHRARVRLARLLENKKDY